MKTPTLRTAALLTLFAGSSSGEVKVDKDVSYGPRPRNVLDLDWKAQKPDQDRILTISFFSFHMALSPCAIRSPISFANQLP